MTNRPGVWRSWIRCCAALIVAAATVTVAAHEPVAVQATRRAFNDAYRRQQWPHAVEKGYELAKLLPNNFREQYNLACVLALDGQADAALDWLSRAAANGFCKVSLLDADPDLEAVRDLPGYQIVRNMVEDNARQRRDRVYRTAASRAPLTLVPKSASGKGRRPLVIALHGYGDTDSNFAQPWAPVVEDFGAILVVPVGPRPVGPGFEWGNVDEADAVVEATLDYARAKLPVDWTRVVLTGFSQGGFMAMAVGLRHPSLFTGVIPMAGGYVPGVDTPPKAANDEPCFYFMVGSRDRSADQVRAAAADFEAAGYDVELRVLQGTGHSFPRRTTTELRRALARVIHEVSAVDDDASPPAAFAPIGVLDVPSGPPPRPSGRKPH